MKKMDDINDAIHETSRSKKMSEA